jgi:cytochrome o ubiquinol oxidase subunit 2
VIKFRRVFCILLSLGLALLLSGCHLDILDPKGAIAASEKNLLIDATLLMLIVVIPVIIINFVFAWWYRASNTKATYRPNDSHSTIIEVICWTIPCIIILILAIMTWISTHRLDPYRPLSVPGKPITIQAIALEWKWLFIYPEQNIATINFMQIPENTQVKILVTSHAPMNSLEIPQLAGQIYAMAGMQTKLHLIANEKGDYDGLSTNFSGDGFSGMRFVVRVSSADDFQQWVNHAQKASQKLDWATYIKLTEPSEKDPVQYFSGLEKDLFNNVMMMFMMPMPGMQIDADGSRFTITNIKH